MGTILTVIAITVAVAAWELTGETAAEYVAKYVVDQENLGASTGEPVSAPRVETEAVGQEPPLATLPVLLTATGSGASAAVSRSSAKGELQPPMQRVAAAPAAVETGPGTTAVGERAAPEGSDDPLLSLIGDTPHRRPDGTVFMPIAAQRVFGLRTVIGERAMVPATVELPGRIVRDPSTAHLIQSAQDGFVEATAEGFVFAGQAVRRGDLLANLKPALSTVERAHLDARIQELANDIDLARKRMARLEEVLMVRYRANRIEQVRVEIEGMRRQLEILRASGDRPVELRAQTDGIVSRVNVASGQFVHAGHTIFEIVDPSRLWVSASAFEPGIQDRIVSASAMTPDGDRLELTFVGGGLALRHQALPLHFAIAGAVPNLTVDTPVTVVAQVEGPPVYGLRVPRASVTRTSDGRQLIWERRSAESFVAHHVSPAAIDAHSVLVTSPIGASARIVTAGVATLGQVQ